MKNALLRCVLGTLGALFPLPSQPQVDPANLYERVLAVVPMVGAGTYEDPKRPLFAPSSAERRARKPGEGIISFRFEPSDDGRFALVEFVALDRRFLDELVKSRRADVKVFVKGRARPEEIEAEFRKYKRDFSARRFAEAAR